MTIEEATRILDEVIPPPEHHTVDIDHLLIAQAWLCIKETLKAEAEPIKHGHWILCANGYSIMCSECHSIWDNSANYPRCPKCGAIMDEVKSDG